MNHIIISTYSTPTLVKSYINKRLKPLYFNLYNPISYTHEEEQVTFITYYFPKEISKINYVTAIAEGIGDFIQREFTSQYAVDMIKNHHDVFKGEKNKTLSLPQDLEEKNNVDELVTSIKEEMLENNKFCIDGWIKFRLDEYKSYIRKKVDRIIFEYLAYQEYEEFIDLLKMFIKTQQSLIKTLHVIPGLNGEIVLYDKNYKEIRKISVEEDTTIAQADGAYKEDTILSTLLMMSPLRIIIHKGKVYRNQRLIQTIKIIYSDIISLCKGCKHCELYGDILTQKKL